ncbi:MAG TPA: GNAT family N-acetyltransferase [Rhodanobacteraceae bacterium]|nr:GNAT family N-acetyltransferase [Rhodanobacteraceae bacterium]
MASSPQGSVHSLPAYLDALCEAAGGSYRVLAAESDGRLVGGIALYEQNSLLGKYISPRLLLHYNGILLAPQVAHSPSQRTARDLHILTALERVLAETSYRRLRLRCRSTLTDLRVFAERGWMLRPVWSYVVDISDLDAAWSRVHKDQRRLIERCRERGLLVSADDEFDAFHRLHMQTHQRKGAPLYLPRERFRHFVQTLRQAGLARLYHARLPSGRIIASQLVLTGPRSSTDTVAASTEEEFLKLGASAFLRWKIFENLSASGYGANDLTGASLGSVARFKSQFGGELVLCLEAARPDRFGFRAGQYALDLAARMKSSLLRSRSTPDGEAA